MVRLIFNPIYTLYSGYLLGISPFIGWCKIFLNLHQSHDDFFSYDVKLNSSNFVPGRFLTTSWAFVIHPLHWKTLFFAKLQKKTSAKKLSTYDQISCWKREQPCRLRSSGFPRLKISTNDNTQGIWFRQLHATLGVLLCMCDKPQAASRATHNLQPKKMDVERKRRKNAK